MLFNIPFFIYSEMVDKILIALNDHMSMLIKKHEKPTKPSLIPVQTAEEFDNINQQIKDVPALNKEMVYILIFYMYRWSFHCFFIKFYIHFLGSIFVFLLRWKCEGKYQRNN